MKRVAIAILSTLLYIALLALFFAQVEIQIEGPTGWAANLPTWRVEQYWWLDWFWGGRPLTGYHLWVFSFMALAFHLPIALLQRCTCPIVQRTFNTFSMICINSARLSTVNNLI